MQKKGKKFLTVSLSAYMILPNLEIASGMTDIQLWLKDITELSYNSGFRPSQKFPSGIRGTGITMKVQESWSQITKGVLLF